MRTPAERSIEVLMWASIVIWLGFALLAHLLSYTWLITIVLSVILLSSAIYQHSQGWHTSLAIWVFGIWMAVFSVIEIVSELVAGITGTAGLNIDLGVYLGVALVSMGVAAVFRTMRVGGQAGGYAPARTGRQTGYTSQTGRQAAYTTGRVPRRVDTQSNSAYTPPTRGQTGRRSSRQPAGYRSNQDDQFDQALEDYGYDEPQADYRAQQGGTQRTRVTGRQTAQRTGRQAAAPRQSANRAPQQNNWRSDFDYEESEQGDAYGGPTQRLPDSQPQRRVDDRRRARPVAGRRSPAAPSTPDTSNDLEARVEDIIRRSRDRRTQPPEDLPY